MGRQRKDQNSELEPGVYRHSKGGYRVKRIDGRFRYFGASRYEDAVEFARMVRAEKGNPDHVNVLVEKWLSELTTRTNNRPATIRNKAYIMRLYGRRWHGKSIINVQHTTLQKVWDTMTDSAYQNHRKTWKQFGAWLVSQGWWDINRVEKTLWRAAQRQKERHTAEGYQIVYNAAEEWLQVAMELAVTSLQDQAVLCDLRTSDIKDQRIQLTRYKTGANLAILMPPGSRLAGAVERARAQGVAGSTLIRRQPQRRRPGPDWSRVTPGYLSHEFTRVRNSSGAYDHLPPNLRPDFRALRSFGGWLYREAGYPDEYVQALYQHRSADLTKYYTESGYAARYMDAEAGL